MISSKFKSAVGTVLAVAVVLSAAVVFDGRQKVSAAGSDIKIDAKNFPDSQFRQYISELFDIDQDGVLSASEVSEIESIVLTTGWNVKNLEGIKLFPNLTYLELLDQLELKTIDLSGMTSLETFMYGTCDDNRGIIESADLSGCESLETLYIEFGNLTSVDLTGVTNIDTMGFMGNRTFSGIDLKMFPNITYLDLEETGMSSVDLSGNTKLEYLWLDNTDISSVDLSHNTALKSVSIEGSKISDLDISMLDDLIGINIAHTGVNMIDISNQKILCDLYAGEYEVETTEEDDAINIEHEVIVGEDDYIYYRLKYDKGTQIVTEHESGVEGFVERLYSVALNRASDPAGKADWVSRIKSGKLSGADAARGFFLSQEFINSNLSDDEFLTRLYRTFFDREPDAGGFNNWKNTLAGGASRESVLNGFINSTEWANLCLTFGISSGGTGVPNITIKPNDQIIGFATRLYTTCLGREPDVSGLNDWATQIANMKISGSAAAHGFFFSDEFINAGHDNEEYVTRLYRTFMGREPDPAGFADWVGQLNNGADRESVFQGFAGSAEWAGICSDYGILR